MTMYNTPSLVSNSLTWERIRTLDLGIDLGFLDNELNVSFDWYQRKTLDMLAPGVTLPDMLGTTEPYTNAGALRTRGWELNLSWNHRFGDFNVYASGNVSDYKTVVTDWNNPQGILSDYFSGKVYGDIYGFETDRLFTKDDFTYDENGNRTGYAKGVANQDGLVNGGNFIYGPGDVKFKDLDGSGTIDGGNGTKDDMGDLKVIGNSTPRYQYGFRLGGSWKGIDLDMYFQGVGNGINGHTVLLSCHSLVEPMESTPIKWTIGQRTIRTLSIRVLIQAAVPTEQYPVSVKALITSIRKVDT